LEGERREKATIKSEKRDPSVIPWFSILVPVCFFMMTMEANAARD
jgi:hypothetical protein